MTILGLEACLLALASLELDDVHLKALHHEETNDLQPTQPVCSKQQVLRANIHPHSIPAPPLSLIRQPLLFSIIDPQHANWNDNQWRHLYALSNPANEEIIRKKGGEESISRGFTLLCCWINKYRKWKLVCMSVCVSICCVLFFEILCLSIIQCNTLDTQPPLNATQYSVNTFRASKLQRNKLNAPQSYIKF